MADQYPSEPAREIPPPVSQFFNQVTPGAGVAEAAPQVPPGSTTPGQVPPPDTSTSVVSEDMDRLLSENLSDYIDSDLLRALREQAKGSVTMPEVIAMAGLAATNPDLAKHIMTERAAGVGSARQMLTGLQSQLSMFRRSELAATQRANTTNQQFALAREKDLRALLKQAQGEAENSGTDTAELGPPPVDVEQIPEYVAGISTLISKRKKEQEQQERETKKAGEMYGWLLASGKAEADPLTVAGAAKSYAEVVLGDKDLSEEEFEAKYGGAVRLAASVGAAARARSEAYRGALRSRAEYQAKLAEKIQRDSDLARVKLQQGDARGTLELVRRLENDIRVMETEAGTREMQGVALQDAGHEEMAAVALEQAAAMKEQALLRRADLEQLKEDATVLLSSRDPYALIEERFQLKLQQMATMIPVKPTPEDPTGMLAMADFLQANPKMKEQFYKDLAADILVGADEDQRHQLQDAITGGALEDFLTKAAEQ